VVGVIAHRHVRLGGQDDVVTAPGQCLADDLLGFAGGVHVGGVDEVDAGIQRTMNDCCAFGVVLGAPVTEHHGAQAQLADLGAGASQRSQFHGETFQKWVSSPVTDLPG
jgi:hypothetical protein